MNSKKGVRKVLMKGGKEKKWAVLLVWSKEVAGKKEKRVSCGRGREDKF